MCLNAFVFLYKCVCRFCAWLCVCVRVFVRVFVLV